MPIGKKDSAVVSPNMGLYLGRPPLLIPDRALKDCLNVRIHQNAVVRDNVGYGPFPDGSATPLNLDGNPVLLIDNFFPRAGGQFLIFATNRDIYVYDEANEDVEYLTPRYNTGTISVTNGSPTVTGTGTAWTTDDNVKAGDFIFSGDANRITQSVAWYQVLSVDSATQLTLDRNYTGSTATGQSYTVRQTFTGDDLDYWESTLFFDGTNFTVGSDGDRWYATNGIDPPVAWDAQSDQVYEPDFGDVRTCRAFAVTKNILMLINITLDIGEARPFSVRTSAIGEPENMVTLEAAEFVAHDGADPLITAFALGEGVTIYGERSITLAQFVGPPTVFVFRNVMNGVGPRSGRSIADFGDFHKFVSTDSQYTFDGIGIQETNEHIWQDVIRRMSPQRAPKLASHFDEERGELVWVVPLNSDADTAFGPPERAYVEHYLEDPGDDVFLDPHSVRELPATAFGFFERLTTLTFDQISERWSDQNYRWNDQFYQAAFPFNLFGTNEGDIFIMNTRDTAYETPMLSYARFGRRAIGSLRNKGMLRRVYPMTETLAGAGHELQVGVFTTDRPWGNLTFEYQGNYDLKQTGNHFLSPRIMARYIEVEFRTEGAGHIWALLGYDIDVVGGGERG